MDAQLAESLSRVCDVLFAEWDPIGVNAFAPRDEYNSYAPELVGLIRTGMDERQVAAHPSEIARARMGLSHVDEARDRAVARRLIELVRVT